MTDRQATEYPPDYQPAPGQPDWSWAFTVYRPIPEFRGYCVGSDGSWWTAHTADHGLGKWRRRRPASLPYGHQVAHLWRGGNRHASLLHRLILEVFIGPCPPGLEACHNNGNPRDNRLNNLRWDTRLSNCADKTRHGRQPRGSRHGVAKLTEGDIPRILHMIEEGRPRREIATTFGVSEGAISNIARGKTWLHAR